MKFANLIEREDFEMHITEYYFIPYFLTGTNRFVEKGGFYKIDNIEICILECEPKSGFISIETQLDYVFGYYKSRCKAILEGKENIWLKNNPYHDDQPKEPYYDKYYDDEVFLIPPRKSNDPSAQECEEILEKRRKYEEYNNKILANKRRVTRIRDTDDIDLDVEMERFKNDKDVIYFRGILNRLRESKNILNFLIFIFHCNYLFF